MSEFLQKAQKKGKIKPLEEAFKEYPVEEEYHKGKIENLLCVQEESSECKLKYKTNKYLARNQENNLDRDSIVKLDVLYKINQDNILFKIGVVDKERLEEYKKKYLEL